MKTRNLITMIAGVAVVMGAAAVWTTGRKGEPPNQFAGKFSGKKAKRFDQPAEAEEFAVAKRRPVGSTTVPMERYLAAAEHAKAMRTHSLQSGSTGPATNRFEPHDVTGGWTFVGPGNVGGRTRSIVIDPGNPNTMYLGGVAGGVWKTTNGGATWTPVGDILPNLAVTTLARDPANASVLYAGTGEGYFNLDAQRGAGIYKTTDGGSTWTPLSFTVNSSDFYYVNKVVVSPVNSNRLYAGTRAGIMRSLDGGATWSRVLSYADSGCTDLVIRTDQPTDYLFAACGLFNQGQLYRNTDASGAGVWTAVFSEPRMGRSSLALAPSNQSIVYALSASLEAGNFNQGLLAVFRSTSNGDTGSWTARVRNTDPAPLNRMLLTNPPIALCSSPAQFFNQGWYDNVIAVDPVDPNIVWTGGIDLFRSNDGGQNWGMASYWYVNNSAHADNHAIVFHPQYNGTSNQILFAGNDGGIYRTSNARANVATGAAAPCNAANTSVTWTNLNNGLGITQFYHGVPYPGGATFFGGTQDNGTVRGTTGGGANAWTRILGGDGGYVAVDTGNTNVLYAENFGLSIQKSTNGGTSFASAVSGISGDSGFPFITTFIMDQNNSQRLWTGGNFVWRTTNGAGSWTRASAALDGSLSAVGIAQGNSEIVAAGTNRGRVYVTQTSSTTGSATVWPNALPRSGNVSWIAFDPSNSNTLYATYSTFNSLPSDDHVYRSTNGGTSWTGIDGTGINSLPDIPVHSIVVDPTSTQRLIVGTDLGVFTSIDGGNSWNREITGFAPAATESLALQNNGGTYTLFAFTHGRGAWQTPINTAAACSYVLNPASRNSPSGGEASSFTVTAGTGCGWNATSNAGWISVTSGASGNGNGTVNFNVQANAGIARQGTITVGQGANTATFTVNQAGAAGGTNDEAAGATLISTLPFNTTSSTAAASANATDPTHSCTSSQDSKTVWYRYVAGFTGTLAVSTAGSNYDTVLTAYPGTTSPGSELACNDNTGGTQQSSIAFAVTNGQSYLIEISGRGPASPGGSLSLNVTQSSTCAVTLNPPSQTFGAAGGADTISVSSAGCSWTAITNDNWISILSGASGTGNGTVQYNVAANNTGFQRNGKISIGNQEFNITQAASCTYVVSPPSQSFPAAGGTNGSVTVTTGGLCAWSATANDPWITITSATSFNGSGSIAYSVAANGGATLRTGSITLAGQSHQVIQAGTALSNDETATATVISALPFNLTQSTASATTNGSDPVQSCGFPGSQNSKSVWFRYNPAAAGAVRFNTAGSNYDTVVSVYRTTATAANEIGCNDDFAGLGTQSQVTVQFNGGDTLFIEITGYGGANGGGNLVLSATSVTNDESTAATVIPSLPFVATQDTRSASSAASDPVHNCTVLADSATVWFRYTATFTGIVNVNTYGSDYDTVVSAYPAANPSAAGELGCDDDSLTGRQSQLSFNVVNGQSYLIQVSSWDVSGGGGLILNAVRLTNDDVAAPIQLSALPYAATQDVRAATTAPGEPAPSCAAQSFHTVWYRYVADFTGVAEFETAQSDYDTILAVYQNSASAANQIACNDDTAATLQSRVSFGVTSGTTYFVGVSAFDLNLGFSGGLLLNGRSSSIVAASMVTPTPGALLTSTSVTFTWNTGGGIDSYRLTVGNTQGGTDLFNGATSTSLSATVNNLPADGRTLHVRLYSNAGAANLFRDYTYIAQGGVNPALRDEVGIFRFGYFWLEDVDGNRGFNSPPDRAFAFGGIAGDIPITGDWSGDGIAKVGIYRPANGLFILDYNGDGQFTGADRAYSLGVGVQPGDLPVVGDWNGSGTSKVGIFRQGFFWILDTNGDGVFQSGPDQAVAFGGVPGDQPVVGDWDGDGRSNLGLFRLGFFWILDVNGNNQIDNVNLANGDKAFPFGGLAGDVPVVGDWNGDGRTKPGIFRFGYFWVLDINGDYDFDGVGPGLDAAFPFGGLAGDKPVIGRW